ncbi:MAG: hypothetical protein KAX11_06355, partial [Candidatus Aminicenantes bacterium]|nr:hypothetical protein [Candidatus Aminicenantes bacterium]
IPFQTLRFKNLDEQTWGLNMGRQVARRREATFWSPILRNFGYFGKFKVSYCGHLQGLWNLEQGSRVQIMPYVIGGGLQEDRDSAFSRSADLGLDLKYRLTSNMTADITVNTDFAQVEADQEQFNLTRFSLFFPEKRGFFLEGADIFRVGEKFRPFEPQASLLFFSRTIGLSGDGKVIPVMGGIRVTGKTGLFDFGILNILTDRLTYGTGEDLSHIERTNFSVFRLKRAVFQKSAFGIMLLSKDSLDGPDYNRGAALDFNLAFGRSLKIEGFAAKTFSPDMKEKDYAANIDISWDSDLLGFMLSYTDIGENFNAEMGFIPRTDIRKYRGKVSIGPRPKFLNLRKSVFLYNLNYIEDHSGRLESRNDMLGVFNLFQNGSSFFFGYIRNYEYLADGFEIRANVLIHRGGHRFNMFMGFYESDHSKKISIRAETNIGQFYNGRLFRVSATAGLKLNKHLNLECIFNRNGFDLPVAEGKFATNIAAARIVYSFSPGLFAKAYLQYNDNDDKLTANFLVRWIYKPGANVYLIYNETREVGIHHLIHDRVLMLKVSFLFNL